MVRDRLFATSPYEGFDPARHPEDLQGWGSDDPVLVEAIQLLRPALICEVGSWKGRSAINMARAAKSLGLETEIVCVDTWLGSSEHWLSSDPEWHESLRICHGFPQLYYTFLGNVMRAGVADIITPFPNTSESAAVVFRALGVRFNVVYIDAAHEYQAVKRDLTDYYDLLLEDGLLIGDDYIGFPSVTQAANDFVLARGLQIVGTGGKFVIPKGAVAAKIALVRP